MTEKRSSIKIPRFILTAVGLAVCGIVFGVLGGIIAGRGLGDGSLADLGLAVIGLMLGYVFGIIIGLFAVKFVLRQRGSVIFGLLAAVVWVGISILIAVPFNLTSNLVSIVVGALLLCVPVSALVGFYLKKQHRA